VTEHEVEPIPGLPEQPPEGESVLWQGAPHWQSVARRIFHAGQISLYFLVLFAIRTVSVMAGGGSAADAAMAIVWTLPLAVIAIAILAFMGWLVGRTTLYTITNRRVVMRIGIVLSVTFNIPFRVIESAGLQKYSDGTGDIALAMSGPDRIAYLHLWPHARPWRFKRPEPALRNLPDASAVAELLMSAIASAEGPVVHPASTRVAATPVTVTTGATPWAAVQ
jgi:hypothetical protein